MKATTGVREPRANRRECRRTVDELPVATGAAEHAFEDKRITVARLEPGVAEQVIDRIEIRRQLKHGFDRATGLAVANQIVICPLAEDELKRADDHRLAGARFTGHADQSGTDFPGQIVDQGEVFYFKNGEHGSRVDSPRSGIRFRASSEWLHYAALPPPVQCPNRMLRPLICVLPGRLKGAYREPH